MQKLIRFYRAVFLAAVLGVISIAVQAQTYQYSPVGYWQTYDPSTGKPTGVVHIWPNHGQLEGKVIKVYGNSVCYNCGGQMHNRTIVGTTVLWGFTQVGNVWKNGKILAVRQGKVYPANMAVTGGGQRLSIQVKTPAFGSRTQTWTRVSQGGGGHYGGPYHGGRSHGGYHGDNGYMYTQ
jgi:uncharacterized protein (DUF2147 family)